MALPTLKENTVSIGLPDVFFKQVRLRRPRLASPPATSNPPYRETVNFKYDRPPTAFIRPAWAIDSDLIHFFRSSGPRA